ncbi:hypothetical protein K1719_022340 [Acacia pycnantha]|nr:hypothetical protein K1719_022340 [Acacia pycnantha]
MRVIEELQPLQKKTQPRPKEQCQVAPHSSNRIAILNLVEGKVVCTQFFPPQIIWTIRYALTHSRSLWQQKLSQNILGYEEQTVAANKTNFSLAECNQVLQQHSL